MENKELIWVEKKVADEYKAIKGNDSQITFMEDYIKKVRKDVREDYEATLDCLNNDLILFKAMNLKTQEAFVKAKNESLSASYDLWKKYDAEKSQINKKVESFISILNPLKDKIEGINKALSSISTYRIKEYMDIIERYSNMSGKQKEIFKLILKTK